MLDPQDAQLALRSWRFAGNLMILPLSFFIAIDSPCSLARPGFVLRCVLLTSSQGYTHTSLCAYADSSHLLLMSLLTFA